MLSITLFVNDDAASGGDGLAWASAYDDLQSALSQAATFNSDATASNDVDQIWIAEGIYKPSVELQSGDARTVAFSLVDGVTLYGGFAGTETTLAARDWAAHTTILSGDLGTIGEITDNAFTVVYCGQNTVSAIDGLKVADGHFPDDNTSHMSYPERTEGCGVFNYGTLTVTNSTISNNTSDFGGGIGNYYGDLTVSNSIISHNTAYGGAGISNKYGTTTIINCSILDNTATVFGAGIYNAAGTITVENSTIAGNTAYYDGGGIYNDSYQDKESIITVTNSTVVDNRSYRNGGGVYTEGDLSTIILNNTIVATNSSSKGPDLYRLGGTLSGSHSLIGDGTDQSSMLNGVDGNQVGFSGAAIDPKLSTRTQLGNGLFGYPLLSGSPAMDAGDNALALDSGGSPLTEDMAGNTRVVNNRVDIGALESAGVSTTYIVTSLDNSVAYDGVLTFTEAFQAATYNTAVGDAAAGSSTNRDIIQFADGLSGTIWVSSQLIISDSLAIEGPGEDLLTFNASSQTRVFFLNPSSDLALSGATITGGYADYGAAIYGNAANLSVIDSTISGNTATADGGGIYNYTGTMSLASSTVSGNTANVGGGMYNAGSLSIVNSTFSNNTANGDGGGVCSSSNPLYIMGSTFSGNSAANFGGGIDAYLGTATIANSMISGNSAIYAAGIDCYGCTMTVTDSTIVNNMSSDRGGGFYSYSGNLKITNSTIANNSTLNYGGAILNDSSRLTVTNSTIAENVARSTSDSIGGGICSVGTTTAITLNNTLLAENQAYYAPDIYNNEGSLSASYSLIGDGTGQASLYNGSNGNKVGTSYSPIDPKLSTLTQFANGMWGYHLADDSPAINGGDNDLAIDPTGRELITDLEGNARIIDNTVDIGAIEMSKQPYVVTSLDNVIANDGILTFIEAFQAANTNLAVGDAPAGSSTETDTITFADGVSGTVLVDSGELAITDDLIIQGPGADALTFDAGEQNRVFDINRCDSVTLSGMTITGGSAEDGAGINNRYSTLHLSDVIVTGNTATDKGGGVSNYSGTMIIENSVISENSAEDGGGISTGFPYVGDLTIINSTVMDNTASDRGGGIYLYSLSDISELTVVNSTLASNTAKYGGGIYNAINYDGVAIVNVTSSTLSENIATSYGGGIYNQGDTASIKLNNTIVASNYTFFASTGPDIYIYGGQLSGSYNLIGIGQGQSSLFNGFNGNQVGYDSSSPLNPMLSELTEFSNGLWGYTPLPSSPVIDAGSNSLALDPDGQALTTDITGNARIFHDTVDIGAVEATNLETPAQTYIVTSLENTIANDGVLTFIEAFEAANTNFPVGDAQAGSPNYQDTIQFATGLVGTVLVDGGSLRITDDLAIEGPGADLLTFDADTQNGVFSIPLEVSVTLSGMTITGGASHGIYNSSGSLTIINSTISDNYISGDDNAGGGIYNYSGTLTIQNSTISNNSAKGWRNSGGGIYNHSGSVSITDSTIYGNAVDYLSYGNGGGIYSASGTLLITNTTIEDNEAEDCGGGIYNDTSVVTITNSTLSNNEAFSHGGGIYNASGELTITNSAIQESLTIFRGAGIYNYSGDVTITGSLVSGNTVSNPVDGGGIYHRDGTLNIANSTFTENSIRGYAGSGVYSDGTLVVTNSTFANNSASYGLSYGSEIHHTGNSTLTLNNTLIVGSERLYQDVYCPSDKLSVSHSLIRKWPQLASSLDGVDGNLVGSASDIIDARLGNLTQFANGLWGYTLLPDSPAIDAGNNSLALDTTGLPLTEDVAGNTRIFNGTVDIGAVESLFIDGPAQTYIVESLENVIASDGVLTFIEAFQAANTYQLVGDAPAGSFAETDKIQFADGLSGTVLVQDDGLVISNDLIIEGPGIELLTFDAAGQSNVFVIDPETSVTLSGMTITGGFADFGGGIWNKGHLTVNDCTISDNTAAASGGGIFSYKGTAIITNSTLSGNSANSGAGLETYDGTTAIIDSVILNNSASNLGGGIYKYDGEMNITNSTILGNSAMNAGGFCSYSGTTTVFNSTISNNSATGDPSSAGGGVANSGSESVMNLHNTIVAGNHAVIGPDLLSDGGTLSGSYCLVGDGTGQTNLVDGADGNQVGTFTSPIDPKLNAAGSPLAGSPAIDTGSNALVPEEVTTDIVGNDRIQNNTVDIGAYETEASTPGLPGDANRDGKVDGSDVTILAGNWQAGVTGEPNATWSMGDFNGDGKVDGSDVTILAGNWQAGVNPPMPGDANLDGKVDGSDVTILAGNWQAGVTGEPNATWGMGDFNGDGKVDGSDVTILAGNWQAGVSSTVIAVSDPEPEPEVKPKQFVPPATASLGVATVPRRESLPPRRFITPASEATDEVLAESTWNESDYTAIAKDLMLVSTNKSTTASDKLFTLGLDPYADLE